MDTNTTFTITCRNKYDSATTSTPTPQITIEQTPPRTPTSTPLPPATPQSTTANPKPALQTITDPKTTSNKVQTSVSAVTPGGRSTDRTPTSSMTSAYGPTEEATRTSNNVLPAVTGVAVGVSFGFLVLIIIILICIIRRKDKTRDEYVSRCACRRSDVNHPDNMYDVMTPREDNHHYEMSAARDSNATADAVHPTYDVMVNRSPENNYQTLAPPVNNGVYVNQ